MTHTFLSANHTNPHTTFPRLSSPSSTFFFVCLLSFLSYLDRDFTSSSAATIDLSSLLKRGGMVIMKMEIEILP